MILNFAFEEQDVNKALGTPLSRQANGRIV